MFRGLHGLPLWLSIGGGGRVHWVQVVQGAGAFVVLSWCVPCLLSCLLSSLLHLPLVDCLQIWLYLAFNGFLTGFLLLYVVCLGLGALR